MEKIVLWIILINTLASVLFAVRNVSEGQKVWLTLFFLVFPVLGFLMYKIPMWLFQIRKKKRL